MHEDLIGYLLGALEPHEMDRVAELLRHDPAAREELAKIEESLRPLEEGYEPVVPRSDLVARTLENLPPLPGVPNSHQESGLIPDTCAPPVTLSPMSDAHGASGRSSMSWLDWVSGSIAVAILLGLLLPAIAQGRFESRNAACQDGLRRFGTMLSYYVTRSQQEQLPAVSAEGREAFAGVYAVRLHDAGLLNEPSMRWCPSMDPPAPEDRLDDAEHFVSVADLHTAPINRLKELQRITGGHYSYTLGVVDQDRLVAPRYKSRTNFAVMSDAPLAITQGRVDSKHIGHSGKGINVLYEDGHTQFFTLDALEAMPDHPLMNHRGLQEAGVNTDDASLGPSWRAPFVNVKQR